jgi:hypothetical protein
MERPQSDPSRILAHRYDLTNLRVQLRLAETLVTGLDEFEREWDRFVGAMHEMIKRCEKQGVSLWDDPRLEDGLKNAEAIRLDLASRQHIVLSELRDPLATFVRTSVRTYSHALWSLIGWTNTVNGRMTVPIDDDGDSVYQVILKKFEINADEAHGEIARRRRTLVGDVNQLKIMLEEAQRATDEAHQLALEKVHAAKLIPLLWAKFKESKVGKVVWWFGEEPLKKLLVALFAAGAVTLVKWLVSR